MQRTSVVLGIETSCDETSAAVVDDGRLVRRCVIGSSKHTFVSSGGVIPEYAARQQVEAILPCVHEALTSAKVTAADLSLIAVTACPGLLGSLLVGTTTARVLSAVHAVPLIGVHHTLGHLSSTWLSDGPADDEPKFPILTLSVSGGHTDLWFRTSHTRGTLLGSTIDDAAGEAFDKGAALLGLGYPGGPLLAELAEKGDESFFAFPKPLSKDRTLDLSFSGLKTSLKYALRDLPAGTIDSGTIRADIAASYQYAIVHQLSDRIERALALHTDCKEVHVVGGVSANRRLRQEIDERAQKHAVRVRYPVALRYCTDNGAMIASAGYFLRQERPQSMSDRCETKATDDLRTLLAA